MRAFVCVLIVGGGGSCTGGRNGACAYLPSTRRQRDLHRRRILSWNKPDKDGEKQKSNKDRWKGRKIEPDPNGVCTGKPGSRDGEGEMDGCSEARLR